MVTAATSDRVLVMVRLWVPADLRPAYLACMADIAAAGGDGLVRVEVGEDAARAGFFVESYLYADLAAWSEAREGAHPRLGPLLDRRRQLVPEDAEECLVYRTVG